MGKYDDVLPRLPLRPPAGETHPRQDKVDVAKNKLICKEDGLPRTATELAHVYVDLRLEREALTQMLSEINLRLEAVSQLLRDSQEEGAPGWGLYGAKPNAIRLPDGSSIRIQPEPYGQVIDREAFRLWCIANGYERQLMLWPSRMNAIVKERLLAGESEPDGTEAASWYKVVYTKGGEEE